MQSDEPVDARVLTCCRENWQQICERVAAVCQQAGRKPESVCIIGVTKYVGLAETRALLVAGCHHLGESRPQSLWEKSAAIGRGPETDVHWHLIGHLQRNKVARALAARPLIHTVDRVRLAESLSREAAAGGGTVDLLLEINLAGDPGRSGVLPESAEALVERVLALPSLRLQGLMGMASHPEAGRDPRQEFAGLRELRDRLAKRFPEAGGLPELSMGMSGDFEAAIMEGSTMVRIGSALFEGLT